ncbi:MAG: GNAT family N-acetyltransferase [Elusimicrobia bacterium]|nr:GNAT family N-acetyltransferase [Elusimicrobiota bacterium]
MTVKYRFIEKTDKKTLFQIISLYSSQDWWDKTDNIKTLKGIIANSHCFLIAKEKEKIIGMGRAISDKISDAYIQDITVDENYRKAGIGSEIIKRIINRLNKGKIRWIGLIAQNNSGDFYKKLGFKKMKNSLPMLMICDEIK